MKTPHTDIIVDEHGLGSCQVSLKFDLQVHSLARTDWVKDVADHGHHLVEVKHLFFEREVAIFEFAKIQ